MMVIFTSVAVTFIPPQLITGLFGMNVKVPFYDGWIEEEVPVEGEELNFWQNLKPYLPFTLIVVIGIGFSMTLLCVFKRQKII